MKEAIHTDRAPAAIGPYSQAVRAGGFLFTSGQIPVDPAAGDIPAGIKAQAQQSLNNIAAILAQAGLDRSAVVKTTVFLKDMNDFAAMNEVYAQFFEGPAYPARSAVEVAGLSSPGRFARPETGASVAPPDTSPRRRAACFADGDKTGCPA